MRRQIGRLAEEFRWVLAGRGSQFDPDVVDAFEFMADEFQEFAQTHADPH